MTDTWVSFASAAEPPALGPLDGRYRAAVAPLVDHLSEAALNRARIHIEVEWLIHLCDTQSVPGAPALPPSDIAYLRDVVSTFDMEDVAELAAIERETVHDVKAVEYYLKRRLQEAPEGSALRDLGELVHFACTSEDINNLAYAVTIRNATTDVWLPTARALVKDVAQIARDNVAQPMLSRTHGQSATPTTVGKEFAVIAQRLQRQMRRIESTQFVGKINGATGTYGAHVAAVPSTDWITITRSVVEGLGLTWNPLTTQIESHDWQAELYSDMARFNRILHNLATDVWTYISLDYFTQVRGQGTVGSSTMPHKVNPIRFENAEANLEISCALLDNLAATLVTSRMQRDLTDSSSQRTIGIAFGHSLLAITNVQKGLAGLDVNKTALAADLDANWEVLGEAIQSAMRAAGIAGTPGMENPYERLKDLTRGAAIDAAALASFIETLGLPDDVQERLLSLTPATYTDLASDLVSFLDEIVDSSTTA